MPKGVYVRQRATLQERFDSKVDKTASECWLWTGAITKNGYGKLGIGGKYGGWALAHRISYELHVGSIPADLQLDHLCRVRHCVNPDHLEPVSLAENLRRGVGSPKHRPWTWKTHCKHGHEFTPENIVWDGGHRRCRECRRLRDRARWPARKAQRQARRASASE